MANRYWVGGTGTWSATNTANWSASSGGAGGASVPTAADAVIFDGLSGRGVTTATITIAADTTVLSLNTNVFNGNINFNSKIVSVAGTGTVLQYGSNVVSAGNPRIKLTYNGATGVSVISSGTLTNSEVPNLLVVGGATATYQLNLTGNFGSIDFTDGVSTNGYRGTVTWTAAIAVYGDWKCSAFMTINSSFAVSFNGTLASQTITSNGRTFACPVSIAGTTALGGRLGSGLAAFVLLGDAFVCNSVFRVDTGNFDTAGYSFSITTFQCNVSAALVYLRASTVSVNTWTLGTTAYLDTGTSTIVMGGTSAGTRVFTGGNKSYYNLVLGGSSAVALNTSIVGNNYFRGTFSSTKTNAQTITFPSAGINTINNWTVTGTAGNLVTVNASATTTTLDISTRANSGNTLGYFTLTNIVFRATPFYATATSTVSGTTNAFASNYVAPFTHYWVGGAGTWDATSTLKWAASSGGASGATAPFADETVVFDSLSGTPGNVTINGNVFCGGVTTTVSGWGLRAGTSPFLYVSGDINLFSGTTWQPTDTVLNPYATMSVNTGGNSLVGTVTVRGGGTVSLASAWGGTATVTHTMGTLATNGYALSTTIYTPDASFLYGSLDLGASTLSCSVFSDCSTPVFTISPGTSTVAMTGTSSGLGGVGRTFYNVSFTNNSVNASNSILSTAVNGTFNNIAIVGPSTTGIRTLTFAASVTVTAGISTSGTAGNRRVVVSSSQAPLRFVLTAASNGSLTDADFVDVYVKGATFSGTRVSAIRCYGITASTPKTVYWNLAGAQNWSANGWAATAAGAPSTDYFPLPQDTATFTNSGAITTITFDTAITYTGTIDFSARTSAVNFTATATTPVIYGSLLLGSGVTFSGAVPLYFSGDTAQTITSNGKSIRGNIVVQQGASVSLGSALDNLSASVTYATDFTIAVNEGTFQTNGYAVSTRAFTSSSTAATFLYLGSSAINVTPTSTTTTGINIGSPANCVTGAFTINYTSQITAAVFNGNGGTYGTVNILRPTVSGTGPYITINGANTFANLYVYGTPSTGAANVYFGANQTVTGVFGVASTAPTQRVYFLSSAAGTARTITVNGSYALSDVDFQDITIAGTAGTATGTRIGNAGGNSNITFDSPKTVYWNLAGAQGWNATGWATSSGGAPAVNNFPLPQDMAVFDDAGSAGTVSAGYAFFYPGINMSGRTLAMTLDSTGIAFSVYGSVSFGSGVTINASTGFYMRGRGATTLTANGVAYSGGSQFYIDALTGTVQLAGALSITQDLRLLSGTFDLAGYALSVRAFISTTTTTRAINLRDSAITLTGNDALTTYVWGMSPATNAFVYTTPQSTITITDSTANTKSFASDDNFCYGRFVIGGSGTSQVNMTTASGFAELASTRTSAYTFNINGAKTIGKWSITGSLGNVVTLAGSGALILYGSATSGIDYLNFTGSTISFSASSTGEFYAGANTVATGANIIKTAPPAPTTRYWVGGSGTWSSSNTANWSASSGGAGGASVPVSLDDVVFDSLSSTANAAYTVTLSGTSMRCNQLTIGGPGGGNSVTFAGTGIPMIHGNINIAATGVIMGGSGNWILTGSTSGKTVNTNGISMSAGGYGFTVAGFNCEWTQASALVLGLTITMTAGTFSTGNYSLGAYLICTSVFPATLNLGASSVGATTAANFGTTRTNFTFNAGTSTVTSGAATFITLSGNGRTFYNYVFNGASANSTYTINGDNTFNNLTFNGPTNAGLINCAISGNQTINGVFTRNATAGANRRYLFRSSVYGTQRTLTLASVGTVSDIDFQDIVVAGAAAPVSGTRLGDAGNNSNITFDSPKTVYWNLAGAQTWEAIGWATSSGGAPAVNNFPLPQDTALFDDAGAITTMTVSTAWVLPSVSMSARTSAMTFTTSVSTSVFGSWFTGTGVTITGSSTTLTFVGRNKTVTIAGGGIPFPQALIINAQGGTVQLTDNLYSTDSATSGVTLTAGTLNTGAYDVVVSYLNWSAAAGTSVTGTGRIILSGLSAKTFAGGGINYNGVSVAQGNGLGALTITGNNILYDIKNLASAYTPATISLGATVQYLTQFTGAGTDGNRLTLSGTSLASPATLSLSSSTVQTVDYLAVNYVKVYPAPAVWNAGSNSITLGGSGWLFSGGGTVYSATILETSTGTDSVLARMRFRSAVSETGTATDTVRAGFLYSSAVLETALVLDAAAGTLIFNRAVSETATGSDATSSVGVFRVTVSDTASASDIVSSRADVSAVVLDSASGSDQVSTRYLALALVAETSSATDAVSSQGTFGAVIQESGSASATVAAANILSVAVAETGTAVDLFATKVTLQSSVAETATISDLPTARMVFATQVSEQGYAADLTAVAPSVFGPRISELTVAADALFARGTFNAYVTDLATASDTMAGRYLWNPIDDTEVANWGAIDNSQASSWTQIDDSQTPTWQNVVTTQAPGWVEVDDSQNPGWITIQQNP